MAGMHVRQRLRGRGGYRAVHAAHDDAEEHAQAHAHDARQDCPGGAVVHEVLLHHLLWRWQLDLLVGLSLLLRRPRLLIRLRHFLRECIGRRPRLS